MLGAPGDVGVEFVGDGGDDGVLGRKYRLNVRGATSAAAAICSTVVLFEPMPKAKLGRCLYQGRALAQLLAFP